MPKLMVKKEVTNKGISKVKRILNELTIAETERLIESYNNSKRKLGAKVETASLANELRRARQQANLSMNEVARRMETSTTLITKLESSNSKTSPKLSTLIRYAEATGHKLIIELKQKTEGQIKTLQESNRETD